MPETVINVTPSEGKPESTTDSLFSWININYAYFRTVPGMLKIAQANPNCIILAVTPANADMATSESLKIARDVDPEGARTLAVVTKLDLMDDGTDALDILTGQVIPVKLGIIGIVNRSQKDIMEGKSIAQNLKEEADFFYSKYRDICDLHGSAYLTKTVQDLLINHIKNYLPKLRERINQKLMIQKSELESLGDGATDRPTLLLDLMTEFSNTYCATIKGDLPNIQTSELYGGARINYVFQESLSATLKSIDALAGLSKGAILTAMQNASGVSPTLFVPEVAFELLVKRQIRRLRSPCLQCVDLIHEELSRVVQNCVEDPDSGLRRFPKLQQEITEVATELLRSRMPITNQMVDHFIEIQQAYINTGHPDFLTNQTSGLNLLTANSEKIESASLTRKSSFTNLKFAELTPQALRTQSQSLLLDKGTKDCDLIQELIRSYFSIVRKSVQDIVPKVIMHFMVNYVVDHMQSELVARLYRSDAGDLLRESAAILEKRKEVSYACSAVALAAATGGCSVVLCLQLIGVICLALATPAVLAGTSWFLFVVVLSFVATLIWVAIYLIGVREALTLPINWTLTELFNTGLVTVLYAIAFIVQLSVWSTPYSSRYRNSNIAAGVFGLINTLVYSAACFLLYRDWRATFAQ